MFRGHPQPDKHTHVAETSGVADAAHLDDADVDLSFRHLEIASAVEAWPQEIAPKIMRRVMTRAANSDTALLRHKPSLCAVCARPDTVVGNLVEFAVGKVTNVQKLHELLSAKTYHDRYHAASADLPSTFIGIPWDALRGTAVDVPRLEPLKNTSDSDGWLLHFATETERQAWNKAAVETPADLTCSCCKHCRRSLNADSPKLPPEAIANDNWSGPVPPELSCLTDAEIIFISRGFTVRSLKQLRRDGDPSSRQYGLFGSTVSFPHEGASVLQQLPRSVASACEMITVYFSDGNSNHLRFCKEHVVRRSKVHAALLWLKAHNPHYADIEIDMDALTALPEDGVPEGMVQAAVPSSISVAREQGPADTTSRDAATTEIHAAIVDNEGEGLDLARLWRMALMAAESSCSSGSFLSCFPRPCIFQCHNR